MMSFSQMMPGDTFPVIVEEGHTETWQVEDVKHEQDTVEVKYRLIHSHVRFDNEAEQRRLELLKPHRKIHQQILDEWVD
jgi:hypothetical protein